MRCLLSTACHFFPSFLSRRLFQMQRAGGRDATRCMGLCNTLHGAMRRVVQGDAACWIGGAGCRPEGVIWMNNERIWSFGHHFFVFLGIKNGNLNNYVYFCPLKHSFIMICRYTNRIHLEYIRTRNIRTRKHLEYIRYRIHLENIRYRIHLEYIRTRKHLENIRYRIHSN